MADQQFLTINYLDRKTIARIFSKIAIDQISGCWDWIGALNTYGYGQIWYHGRDELAHRVLYAWLVAPIPRRHGRDIQQLDHIVCDRPRCCNPAHVILTTLKKNVLRSNSVSGIAARQTHCLRGHLLPAERNRSDGKGRECKICRALQCADYYQRVGKPRQAVARSASAKKPTLTPEERKSRQRKYMRRWQAEHREELRAYHREYHQSKKGPFHV